MPVSDDLFDETDNDSDLVKSLRKALKTANQSLKEKDEALNDYAKKSRATSLADVLKSKGLDNPKVTKLYPADAEATEEAVDAWLAEFGDVFGIEQKPAVDEGTQAAAAKMTQVSANAPNTQTSQDLSVLAAAIANAKNEEELAAAYEAAGLK